MQYNLSDYYSYKIVRDYGFAPNPFHGFCTLATCKPHLRLKANIGDWIIGSGGKTTNLENRIIYAMRISEKLSFEEYWNDIRFTRKKPTIPGSLNRIHGDNIYYKGEAGEWQQLPSHHSNNDFSPNLTHMNNDLSGKFVLISDFFYYFGNKHFLVPSQFKEICSTFRDYQKIQDYGIAEKFILYLNQQYQRGVIGEPINWTEYFQRTLF